MLGSASRSAVAITLLTLAIAAWPLRTTPEVNGDGRLATAYALVDQGSVDLDPYVEELNVLAIDLAVADGHYVLAKQILPTLVIALPYSAARLVLPPARMDDELWRWALTLAVSGLAFALSVTLIQRLARRGGIDARPPAVLVVLLATPLVVYSAYLLSHMAAAALLAALVLAATQRGRTMAAITGMVAGALYSTETLMAVAAVPAVVYSGWRDRHDVGAIGLLLTGGLVGVAPQLGWAWAVFGSPFADPNDHLADALARQAYIDPARDTAPALALAQLLFSPTYGLFIYAPALVAGAGLLIRRWRDPVARLSLLCGIAPIAALVVMAPDLVDWHDRAQYGPRTVLAVAPLLVWPLLALPPRILAIAGVIAAAPHVLAHAAFEPLLDPSYVFAYGELFQAIPRGAVAPSLAGAALTSWLGPWSHAHAALVFAIVLLALVPILARAVGARVDAEPAADTPARGA